MTSFARDPRPYMSKESIQDLCNAFSWGSDTPAQAVASMQEWDDVPSEAQGTTQGNRVMNEGPAQAAGVPLGNAFGVLLSHNTSYLGCVGTVMSNTHR
jgi:hypothetical protein